VGFGKTLLLELIAAILGLTRAILVIPANLRDKTYADRASYLGKWRLASPPPVLVSREELADESRHHYLERLNPDGILVDEADELANADSAACRRIDRFVQPRTREECAVVCLSGTPSRKSIMGYWHQLGWVLRDAAPMPHNYAEAKMWAAALDYGPSRVRRPGPGPLGGTRAQALAWFQRRLSETPGVVIVDGDSAGDLPLTIRVRPSREDKTLDKHFKQFLLEQQNPDGIPVTDPLSRWRMDGFLGCGLYKKWNPPPPEEWRAARRAVAKLVRDAIEASTNTARPLDTEKQVLKRHAQHPAVIEWLRIKPMFDEHQTETVWVSGSTIESAIEWLNESSEPGIIWCGGVDFAHALAGVTRLSNYGPKGRDQNGNGLHVAPEGKSLIASWHANKKGFNLQAWARQLIVHPPQSAKWLEQIFGRSHRSGATRPVVITVLATSGGTLDAFESAIGEAGFARGSVGLTQKILRAQIERVRVRVTESNKFRWAQRDRA